MKSPAESPVYAADPTSEAPGTDVLRSTARWYEDLAVVLSNPRRAINNVFVIMAVLMLTALAITYWGFFTDHPNIAIGAMVAFLAAMIIWIGISFVVLAIIAKDVAKWLANRRRLR